MGVLPLEFADPNGWTDLQLSGDERFEFGKLDGLVVGDNPIAARVTGSDGDRTLQLNLPIHTSTELDYLRHGGLLPFVVRQALQRASTELTR